MKITKYDIFAIVFDIILIIVLSLLFYLAHDIKSSKVVYIPSGSINKIISYLEDRNFEVSKLDAYLIRFFGTPQSGWIDIGRTRLSRGDFLYKLTHSKAALMKITLIPGETKELFFSELAKSMHLSYEKLIYEYDKLTDIKDGVILADTYIVPIGMSERHLVSYLVYNSLYKHRKLSQKIFGVYNKKKWFWYVSIASIIQKEAANKKEMPLISAVIHNRIKKGMKLQMDGSLKYGIYSHKKITPSRIRNDNSPYNTYKIKGVPVNPVCSIGLDALRAAIFPSKKEYLYFVKGKNKTHIFSNTYKKHLQNIRSGNR
jgi:UPF0755 protein